VEVIRRVRGEGGWFYLGRSALYPLAGAERFARVVIAVQKSAEGIVVAGSGEGPNDGRVQGRRAHAGKAAEQPDGAGFAGGWTRRSAGSESLRKSG